MGNSPGPVAQTEYPNSHSYFPTIAMNPESKTYPTFFNMKRNQSPPKHQLVRIMPIVDNVKWIERLCQIVLKEDDDDNKMISDVQLRIKDTTNDFVIRDRVRQAQLHCTKAGIRLWINDHWKAAIDEKCFGVHVGQEDLAKCYDSGGLDKISKN